MIVQKTFILFILFILSIVEPLQLSRQTETYKNSPYLSIDSVFSKAELSGWDNTKLGLSDVYFSNSADRAELENILRNISYSWEITYLRSLLLKKESKFAEMYDSLFKVIDQEPLYLPFYSRLVSAASAENRLNFLKTHLDEKQFNPLIKSYTNSLILKELSRYSEALKYAEESFKEDSLDFNILHNLYEINRSLGDYDKAAVYTGIMLTRKSNNTFEQTEALYASGSLYFLSSRYKEAEKQYNAGIKIAEKNSLTLLLAKGNINKGIIEDMKGNTDAARSNFRKASKLASEVPDISVEAHALSELGVSYSFTNELIEAKNNYLESYHLFKKLNDKRRLSFLSENLGKIYMQMFDYRSALKYFEEGLNFAGENKRAAALNLTGMADVYANLSNYTKALFFYKEAKQLSSEIKELSISAEIDLGLGTLNFNLNRNGTALRYLTAAGNFADEAEDPYMSAVVWHKMGLLYTETDSLSQAENCFRRAAESANQTGDKYTEALSLIDMASALLLQDEESRALSSLDKGIRISEGNDFPYLSALAELTRGDIYQRQKNFNKAKESFLRSLSVAKELNEFNLRITANHRLAELFGEGNFTEAAASYYNSALSLVEDASYPLFGDEDIQIAYFSGKRDVYDSYASFLIEQRYYAKAFEIIDKSRSRSTIQHLNNLKLQEFVKDETVLNSIYEYDWIITSGVYGDEKTDSVRQKYSALKKEIIASNAQAAKYLQKGKHIEVREIQEKLNYDENIISIYTTSVGTYLFLITDKTFTHSYLQLNRQDIIQLASAVSPYYDPSASSSVYFNQHLFSFNAEAAYKLYDTLLAGILQTVPEGEKIIFSASAELASFPFEFLVKSFSGNESRYNYKNKDYLVHHYNISYTPSVNIFIEQKQNKLKNNNRVLIVGNPSINNRIEGYAERRGLLEETGGIPRSAALLPLKYSAYEVNEISGIINADKILMENSATETNFKKNAPLSRIIHLSTHSFLYRKQPVIFFSNFYDAENDGFLEAGEIVNLKLNSDLVVLSSCNSGLGTVDESEGIIGMSKAFFETGTKSVIVSLWEVNDKYTSVLMKLFYEKLSEGYDKSEALRMAKIDFIRDYSANPYYWSAFILTGDTSELKITSSVKIQVYVAVLAFVLLLSLVVSLVIRRKKPEVLLSTGT